MSRLRVLLLAEQANPDWVSVPSVGWRHVQMISTFADVHLVTHVRNRDNILKAGFPAEQVTFIGQSGLELGMDALGKVLTSKAAMGGIGQTALSVPLYYRFEYRVWDLFRQRLAESEFDLVHRVTPLSPGVPSWFAMECSRLNVPFVWGPINGGVPWPRGFEEERRREGEWLGQFRGMYRLLPFTSATRRCASAIMVGSAAAWNELPAEHHARSFYMPENAIDMTQFSKRSKAYAEKPLRVAFVGRMVACKGIELLMRGALPHLKDQSMALDLIGDGPEREVALRIADENGVSNSVRADGWVPHAELQDRLCESAVLGFPSIREFGGAAVMEAMALGLVPVVADYGGPSEVVTDDCGFRVSLSERGQVIHELQRVFERLKKLPTRALAAMGEKAHQRIRDSFSVEAKTQKTQKIYDWVLKPGSTRPHFVPPAHSLRLYETH